MKRSNNNSLERMTMNKVLESIENIHLNQAVIGYYLDIYRFIGKNDHFIHQVDVDYDAFVMQVVKEDTFFLASLLKLSIKEDRLKALLIKDLKPRSHDEKILIKLKHAFVTIHENIATFELIANEIVSLIQFIYGDIAKASDLSFGRINAESQHTILDSKTKSKRTVLEQIVDLYNKAYKNKAIEKGLLASSFYLDFMYLKPFNKYNEGIGYLLLYILLLNSDYKCFDMVSFFGIITRRHQGFLEAKDTALKNYDSGYASPLVLHEFLCDVTLEAYKTMTKTIKNYTFDHQYQKGDVLEQSIKKLGEVFTKEELRHLHPNVSESTINRTLKRLKEEKKLMPLGTGRSAKWMKLTKKETPKIREQMRLKV